MNRKTVEAVIAPPAPHMVGDGFRVHNFIPGPRGLGMVRMSPFIMLDYNSKTYFPPTDKPRGVGVHPHRGFETVTIAYKGKVAHHDSTGNSGVIGEGDVQWMTAAAGILHKEYHEEAFSRAGGDFQMVQLWVNLPARHKMSPPKYQAITAEQIALHCLPADDGTIEVIAGRFGDVEGPASTFTPLHLLNVRLKEGAKAEFRFPKNFNTAVLAVEGSAVINGSETLPTNHFALFHNDGEEFTIEATEQSVLLVLSGEPIAEPIAAHGPFVMNTKNEILQAMEDMKAGRFGHLEE